MTDTTIAVVAARDRLHDLEAQAEPLRTRLGEVEAAIAKLDAPADPAVPLSDVLAQKRADRNARIELEVEREVLSRSAGDPLEAQVATAKAEAADAERISARAVAVANGLAGLETVAAADRGIGAGSGRSARPRSADRQNGIHWDFVQSCTLSGREAKQRGRSAQCQTKLRSIGRF